MPTEIGEIKVFKLDYFQFHVGIKLQTSLIYHYQKGEYYNCPYYAMIAKI